VDKTNVMFQMAIDAEISTRFSTPGVKENEHLQFSDPNEQTYHFQFRPEEVLLHRTGPEELRLVFQLGKVSSGILKVDGFEFVTQVFTKKLNVSEQEVKLEYDLLDGNKILSNHQMLVKWDN
jgi:uncharacterized beta-barrel protein YwiB (DUF1934 family)